MSDFYESLYHDLYEVIESVLDKRGHATTDTFRFFLDSTEISNNTTMRRFFRKLEGHLRAEYDVKRAILIIDEFDGIPKEALVGFLRSLRRIYVSDPTNRCPPASA